MLERLRRPQKQRASKKGVHLYKNIKRTKKIKVHTLIEERENRSTGAIHTRTITKFNISMWTMTSYKEQCSRTYPMTILTVRTKLPVQIM